MSSFPGRNVLLMMWKKVGGAREPSSWAPEAHAKSTRLTRTDKCNIHNKWLVGFTGQIRTMVIILHKNKKKKKTCLLVFLKQFLPNPMWIRAENNRKTKQTTSSQNCRHFILCWLKRLNNSADANWFLVHPSPSHHHPSLILCNQVDFGPVEAEWCLVP